MATLNDENDTQLCSGIYEFMAALNDTKGTQLCGGIHEFMPTLNDVNGTQLCGCTHGVMNAFEDEKKCGCTHEHYFFILNTLRINIFQSLLSTNTLSERTHSEKKTQHFLSIL